MKSRNKICTYKKNHQYHSLVLAFLLIIQRVRHIACSCDTAKYRVVQMKVKPRKILLTSLTCHQSISKNTSYLFHASIGRTTIIINWFDIGRENHRKVGSCQDNDHVARNNNCVCVHITFTYTIQHSFSSDQKGETLDSLSIMIACPRAKFSRTCGLLTCSASASLLLLSWLSCSNHWLFFSYLFNFELILLVWVFGRNAIKF